jgi:hypothetical protein
MMFPKHKYVRSKNLLEAARLIPCQHCGIEDGTVCAAHINWGGGKGRAIKADDNLIASLCHACHSALDQGSDMTKEERQNLWFKAHQRTVLVLLATRKWPDKVPINEITDASIPIF